MQKLIHAPASRVGHYEKARALLHRRRVWDSNPGLEGAAQLPSLMETWDTNVTYMVVVCRWPLICLVYLLRHWFKANSILHIQILK